MPLDTTGDNAPRVVPFQWGSSSRIAKVSKRCLKHTLSCSLLIGAESELITQLHPEQVSYPAGGAEVVRVQ